MSVIIDFNDIYEVKDQTGANIVSLKYGNDTIFTQEWLFTITLDPAVESAYLYIIPKGNVEPAKFYYWNGTEPNDDLSNFDGEFTASASNGIKINGGVPFRIYRKEIGPLSHSSTDYHQIQLNANKYTVSGDLSSLTGYCTDDELQTSHFERLFYNTNIIDARYLIIPWNKLPQACFESMFEGCNYLTSAPDLPATHCESYSYRWMFKNCYLLEKTPFIGLKTLNGEANCHQMFVNCTGLKVAIVPDIDSPVMYCFRQMFNGCTSLQYIECLLKTPSVDYTGNWSTNLPTEGVFYKYPGTKWPTGVSGIPAGWEIKDKYM